MKTTKKHFDVFEKECRRWIKIFGLYGYEWEIVHENTKERNNLATTTFNCVDRWARIRLNTDWGTYPITERNLRLTALHEVVEGGLFGKMRDIAEGRWGYDKYDYDEAVHEVIRIFENVIFERFEDGNRSK